MRGPAAVAFAACLLLLAGAGAARAAEPATDILGFDMSGWAGGPAAGYWPRRQALEAALRTAASDTDRDPGEDAAGARRLALVRFHLAHGDGAEALGHLAHLPESAATGAQRRLLAGVAHVQAGHLADGLRMLSDPALAQDRHAQAWRALGAVRRGDWAGVARLLAELGPDRLADLLTVYDADVAEELLLGAARAATLRGDRTLAGVLETAGTHRTLPAAAAARVALLGGDRAAARARLADAAGAEAAYLRLLLDGGPAGDRRAGLDALARDAHGPLAAEIWAEAARQARADGAPRAAFEAAARARAESPPGPWREALGADAAAELARLLAPPDGAPPPVPALLAAETFLAHRDLVEGASDRLGLLEGFAATLARLGLPEAAARVLRRAAALPEAAPVRSRLALAAGSHALAAGDASLARTLSASVMAARPGHAEGRAARRLAARALGAMGDAGGALSLLDGTDLAVLDARAAIAWGAGAWPAAAEAIPALIAAADAPTAGEMSAERRRYPAAGVGTLARRAAVAMIRAGAPDTGRLARLAARAGVRDGARVAALSAVATSDAPAGSDRDIRDLRAALEVLSEGPRPPAVRDVTDLPTTFTFR